MTPRGAILAAIALLAILHQDFWWWDEPGRLLGLPIGLTYHVLYCFAASLLFAVLVRRAWPAHLDDDVAEGDGR